MIDSKPILKLHYFNNRMNCIYRENGFFSIPFDDEEMRNIIRGSANDLKPLFIKCFGNMGSHLLDKFCHFSGDVFEFYNSLGSENKDLFIAFDW
jgi:hypothetical protein